MPGNRNKRVTPSDDSDIFVLTTYYSSTKGEQEETVRTKGGRTKRRGEVQLDNEISRNEL